jgi:hypothetical protein
LEASVYLRRSFDVQLADRRSAGDMWPDGSYATSRAALDHQTRVDQPQPLPGQVVRKQRASSSTPHSVFYS